MSLKQRVVGLLAAGGDVLTAVNAASELYDFPLKFRGNKEEWESFGKCVADAMVDVVAGIDLCNASNEEVKLRMESVTKLSEWKDNQVPTTPSPTRRTPAGSVIRGSAASAFFKVSHCRPSRLSSGDSENRVLLRSAMAGADKIPQNTHMHAHTVQVSSSSSLFDVTWLSESRHINSGLRSSSSSTKVQWDRSPMIKRWTRFHRVTKCIFRTYNYEEKDLKRLDSKEESKKGGAAQRETVGSYGFWRS
ncbi:uncharacterized protein EI90DRAFT_3026407 [Cantharellus anzutake]|uniref:uncharacterized protein n=1 Tax=Cantharellus anzutake TaxID=1750568 RepID=UPI00190370ED|nr:uncharacterized protein EI90DRAFT_3026407 [Cantharellus anzutake]KAF8307573.1 hypothetical protein EI90DRAFT_3026407 [Cantharellus anzutake]